MIHVCAELIQFSSLLFVPVETLRKTLFELQQFFVKMVLCLFCSSFLIIYKVNNFFFFIDSSLEQGYFPLKLKELIIFPSLKKRILDPEDNNNFRPISNLSFLSKTIGRIFARQLSNGSSAICQDAYRQHYFECLMILTVQFVIKTNAL